MAQIPRKPTFPDHLINKLIARIEQDVQQNVIPVSTGIYTQQKLVNLLQAIPKPILVDYDQRIFFQLTEKQMACPLSQCPICHHDYNNRRKPVMCHFCTKWACDECICHRDRLHPMDNNHNGKRYSICYDCDGKYLTLQLNHPYVYNRMMIQTAIVEVSKQLQSVQANLQNEKRKIESVKAQPKRKLNMKLSILKKQDLDVRKNIKKISWDVEAQKDKRAKLQQKLAQAKIKYSKMVEHKKRQQLLKQKQLKQRQQRQQRQRQQQQQKRLAQQKRAIEQQIQRKRQQQQRRQQQQSQRILREAQRQKLRLLELQLQKQKQKQKNRQKQKQIQAQKQRHRQLQRLKQLQKQKQIQRQKQLERKKQQQRQNQLQRQKYAQRQKQLQKRKQYERQLKLQQMQNLKQMEQKRRKQQQQRRQQTQRKLKQIQDLKTQLKIKQQLQKQKERQIQQQLNRVSKLSNKLQRSSQFDQYFNQTSPNDPISHPDDFLSPTSTNYQFSTSSNQVSFTIDPQKNNSEQQQPTSTGQNSHRNSYLFNQFKSYYTQQIMKNAQVEPQAPSKKPLSNQNLLTTVSKQEILSNFRRSLQQQQHKAAQSQQINSAKMQIFKQAETKRRNYQVMKVQQQEQQVRIITPSEKCKCSVF